MTNALIVLKLKALIAAGCISLSGPPHWESELGPIIGGRYNTPTEAQLKRKHAGRLIKEADQLEKCEELKRELREGVGK